MVRECRRLIVFLLIFAGCRGGSEELLLGPGALFAEPEPGTDASTPPPGRLTPLPTPDVERYRIRTGDVLTISVMGEAEMTRSLPVGPDGRISYYLANDVMAAGRTFEELRKTLEEALRPHFKSPVVTVTGKEFRGNKISVLGMVHKPGEYEIRSDTRLMDVLAAAGGVSQRGFWTTQGWTYDLPDFKRAFLMRGDRFVDVDFKDLLSDNERLVAQNNVYLRAGDRIYIPSTSSSENKVMVLGEVQRPRVVRFQREISFMEAVAEAGGVKHSAWERRSFVVRGSLKKPTVIPVNLREVAVGRAADVALQSGDIIFVPKTALGKVEEITRQILPLVQGAAYVDDLVR
ncbi:MAG: polysaccharide biosynthesis/export family protein [Planctomycetota bacterium]|jgi:polysaccharide export outer membrane protein